MVEQSPSTSRSGLERVGSTSERGLLTWMRNAFSAPSRSGTPFQPDRDRSASGNHSRPSPSSNNASKHQREVSSPHSQPKLPFPSHQPPPPPHLHTQVRRLRSQASLAGSSIDDDGPDYYDEEQDEPDSDDEIYVPYKPSAQVICDDDNDDDGTAADEGEDAAKAPSAAPPCMVAAGLVKPMARRRVSLNYGVEDKDDLSAEAAMLHLASREAKVAHDKDQDQYQSPNMSRSASTMTDSTSSSKPSRISLVLTPPDSDESQEIQSPLQADWNTGPPATPAGIPLHQAAQDFTPLLTRSYSIEDDITGEGNNFANAEGLQATQSKGAVLVGSRPSQLRQAEEGSNSGSASGSGSSADNGRMDAWDESRAKTPKAFADLRGVASNDTDTTTAPAPAPLVSPAAAAEEIANDAGPTPRPFWASPQQVRPVAVKPNSPPAATTSSPQRRRLFGRRRIESLSNSKLSGEDSTTSHEGSRGVPSFFRLGRKISASSSSNTPPPPAAPVNGNAHRHSLVPSISTASGFSVEVPESTTSSGLAASSRPTSMIMQSDTRSIGHSSRGKTTRVKIRAGVGLHGQATPKRAKSRAKNKQPCHLCFNKLYLAQELHLDGNPSNIPAEPNPSLANRLSADLSADQRDYRGHPTRHDMASTESQQSLASSTMSHGTMGSFSSYAGQGGRKATWAMKFSLDGRYLAAAGQDRVIRVFEVLDTPEKRQAEVTFLLSREEARRPSTASGTSSLEEGPPPSRRSKTSGGVNEKDCLAPLPVFSSRPVAEFRGHTSDVLSLDWSKGNFLLSSSMDKTVRVWHLSRPVSSLVSFVHGDFVCSAVFHKDDRFFLSGSLDGKLRLWNIAAKKVHAVVDVPGLITAVSFSSSCEYAIAGTFSGALLFYKTDDLSYLYSIAVRRSSGKNARGTKITGIEAVQNTTHDPIQQQHLQVGSSPSLPKPSERILISSNDSRVRVFSLTEKRLTAKYKGSTYLNRTSQIRASTLDDTFVVAGSESGEVYVWDWMKEKPPPGGTSSGSGGGGGGVGTSTSTPSLTALGGGGGSGGTGEEDPPMNMTASSCQTYECWTAADGAKPITVSLLAPLKTHGLLGLAGDSVMLEREEPSITNNNNKSEASNLQSTLRRDPAKITQAVGTRRSNSDKSSTSTTSSNNSANDTHHGNVANGKKGSSNGNGNGNSSSSSNKLKLAHPKENRILLSVDESQIVRVWRCISS